jgi:hypothetical protein
MPSQHIWTEKDANGARREVRATKFGGKWRLQAKQAADLDWTYYDRPQLDDLLKLKEIIARKYQRRRATADDVVAVDKLISEIQADG